MRHFEGVFSLFSSVGKITMSVVKLVVLGARSARFFQGFWHSGTRKPEIFSGAAGGARVEGVLWGLGPGGGVTS